MKTLHSLLVSMLTLAAVACGDTPADPGQTPPLAVVKGTIVVDGEQPALTSSLQTAVVWHNLDVHKTQVYAVVQGVEVKPEFPSSFELALSAPPPASAVTMLDFSEDKESKPVRGAFGELIAYEDLNGNGQLDLVKEGDPAYIDRISGSVDGNAFRQATTLVAWFDAQDVAQAATYMPGDDGSTPSAGYNLFLVTTVEGVTQARWTTLDQPVKLVLHNDAQGQEVMCSTSSDNDGEYVSPPLPTDDSKVPVWPEANGPLPTADDPGLQCYITTSDKVFGYQQCTTTNEVCHSVTTCTTTYWRKPTDVGNWACSGT